MKPNTTSEAMVEATEKFITEQIKSFTPNTSSGDIHVIAELVRSITIAKRTIRLENLDAKENDKPSE